MSIDVFGRLKDEQTHVETAHPALQTYQTGAFTTSKHRENNYTRSRDVTYFPDRVPDRRML